MMLRLESVSARPLVVPLRDPFVIASGRIDATRAALVEVVLRDVATGATARGLGEAAALPPVTREDTPELLDAAAAFARALTTTTGTGDDAVACVASWMARAPDEVTMSPVAAAALETALLDAAARLAGRPLYALLAPGGGHATEMTSDITIPIHAPSYMGELAQGWRAKGFRCFKVKVGLDLARDVEGLSHILARVPDARFRIDANGGYGAREAVALWEAATRAGAVVECFEQPCARDDLEGMAAVARSIGAPVVADESVRTLDDLARVLEARAAGGVNLKLVKHRGPLGAMAVGRAARAAGLALMVGAMVETRLGITAAAHVCAALGGADWVDLDTAWLMAEDPFVGGYESEGAGMRLPAGAGLALEAVTA